MFGAITDIKFTDDNMTEAVPAYLCIIAMPLFYSISEGISIGIISYVVLNAVCGKAKKVKPLMYVLAVLFVLKYVLLKKDKKEQKTSFFWRKTEKRRFFYKKVLDY